MVLISFPKKKSIIINLFNLSIFSPGPNTISDSDNKMLLCSFHKNHPMEMKVVSRECISVYVCSKAVIRTLH